MKVVLDLDDFTVVNNRLDLLLKLKEYFQNFKVSLFTVPVDTKTDYGPYLLRKDFLIEIKKHLDWMQLIPHGLVHNSASEMMTPGYSVFKTNVIPKIKKAFDDDGLPFVNGFKGPHWKWSKGVVDTLDELNWWGAIKRDDNGMPKPKKFYKYSHSLDENYLDSNLDVIKLHGHIYGCKDDLGINFQNLLKLPKDTEFYYCTDFLQS